jgi:hypothetical protein
MCDPSVSALGLGIVSQGPNLFIFLNSEIHPQGLKSLKFLSFSAQLKPCPDENQERTAKSKEPAGRRRYGRALKPFGDARPTAAVLVAG